MMIFKIKTAQKAHKRGLKFMRSLIRAFASLLSILWL